MTSGFAALSYRIGLRPVAPGDAAATAALMTADVAARLLAWPSPLGAGDARARIDRAAEALAARTGAELAILRLRDARLIGWIGAGVIRDAPRVGSLGYWLATAYQGQGYMAEALNAALPWLVRQLGLAAIEACAQADNFASQALLEGLGFQLKARRRLLSPVRGEEEDAIAFAVPSARLRLTPAYQPELRAAAAMR